MILKAGLWMGRGSFRPTTESLGTVFKANIQVSDDVAAGGLLVEATLAVEGSGERSITAWIVADEYGTYAVAVRGMGLDAQGTAKLESEPHLGALVVRERRCACCLHVVRVARVAWAAWLREDGYNYLDLGVGAATGARRRG